MEVGFSGEFEDRSIIWEEGFGGAFGELHSELFRRDADLREFKISNAARISIPVSGGGGGDAGFCGIEAIFDFGFPQINFQKEWLNFTAFT